MTVPEARRDPELARFDLRRKRLQLPGGIVSLVVPASMGALVHGEGADDPDRQPYWAEIWPASLGLARLLLKGPELTGRRVLDLGCGLGLAGTAAGMKGAHVFFADREPAALPFARFNAAHNGAKLVETLSFDWNGDAPLPAFDLVLLADVTYSERNHAPLLRVLERCLAAEGYALACDPFRDGGAAFARGAALAFECAQTESDCYFDDRRLALRVLEIRRRRASGGQTEL